MAITLHISGQEGAPHRMPDIRLPEELGMHTSLVNRGIWSTGWELEASVSIPIFSWFPQIQFI